MKIRIKDARKFSKFLSVIVSAMLVMVFLFATTLASAELECEYQEITVAPGDTLWEIAKEYMSDTAPGRAVYEIVQYNDKDTSGVFVGETLKIPLR